MIGTSCRPSGLTPVRTAVMMSASLHQPSPVSGIRGQIRRVEDAEARDLEADLRAGQRTLHVRLAEKGAGRMAACAIHDGRQILAALRLALCEGWRN